MTDASSPRTGSATVGAEAGPPSEVPPAPWRQLSPAQRTGRVVTLAVVLTGAVVFALPFFWMLSTSFKTEDQIFTYPPQWIPTEWTWENDLEPWRNLPFALFYRNTAVITFIAVVARVLTAALAAFAFARMRFPGRNLLFLLVLATMMLPGQVTLIPLFRFWSELGLVDTIAPLTIPSFFAGEGPGAFSIFLLRQYMLTIPIDLDGAAKLDGASWFRIFWNIILPMSGPALGVAAIFQFTGEWNAFLEPLIYLRSEENYTVQLGLASLNGRFALAYGQTMAQTILSLIPVLLVFFFAQRRYVQGIVVSGVKG